MHETFRQMDLKAGWVTLFAVTNLRAGGSYFTVKDATPKNTRFTTNGFWSSDLPECLPSIGMQQDD